MKIAVVGTGYVGLVTGTCFAETGNTVTCIDIDEDKVERMRNGEVPIYEPGLEVLFERNTKQKRLTFTTDLAAGIKDAQIIFLALPTPPGADGSADLSFVLKVAADLSQIIEDYKVIVDKSTVPVGTAEKVHAVLAENLDESLNRQFAGKVVRKDLTKLLKEGANVPVYVLEYLLGQYCASDDEAQDGHHY